MKLYLKKLLFLLIAANSYSMQNIKRSKKRGRSEETDQKNLDKIENKKQKLTISKKLEHSNQHIIAEPRNLKKVKKVVFLLQESHETEESIEEFLKILSERQTTKTGLLLLSHLPPELMYPIVISIVESYMNATIDQSLSQLNQSTKKTLFLALYSAKSKFEKYVTNLLKALVKIDIKQQGTLVTIIKTIHDKEHFIKTISSNFKQAIIVKLHDIGPEVNTEFCTHVIQKMRRQAYSTIDNLANYTNPWKFLLKPLVAKLSAKDCEDYFIICWAAQTDNLEFIKENNSILQIISGKDDAEDLIDHDGTTLLIHAISSGALDVATWLITKKFQLNKKDICTKTAAFSVVILLGNQPTILPKCRELLKLLFDNGAKLINLDSKIELTEYRTILTKHPLIEEIEQANRDMSIKALLKNQAKKQKEAIFQKKQDAHSSQVYSLSFRGM